eukprot:6446352-Pyramimonas_sp.AAC.1
MGTGSSSELLPSNEHRLTDPWSGPGPNDGLTSLYGDRVCPFRVSRGIYSSSWGGGVVGICMRGG